MIERHDSMRRVLAKLQNVKRSGGGYTAQCPAHPDKHNSLGIDKIDGKVCLKCHAGCSTEAVVAAIDLRMTDLFDEPPKAPEEREVKQGPKSCTLDALCAHKRLPRDFVCSLGWREYSQNGLSRVEIPYFDRHGKVVRVRHRFALAAKEGSSWNSGKALIAYEPDKGALAFTERYVLIVEGETDTVTCLYAGIPAIGLPGATQQKCLEAHHVAGLDRVFISQEPDQGGEKFVAGVKERLQELGYDGPVFVFKTPNAAKDPNALYQRDPEKFAEAMAAAFVEASKPPPELLDDVWKTLGEWGSLTNEPPPRKWLLQRPDDETDGERQVGVLPLGKVGMLVSAGGVGKTMALVELALSVATGRKWLDFFAVANSGRVLLALGEEDAEEIGRRVFQAARAMRLTDQQMELAASNIVAMPLTGRPVALVDGDGATSTASAMLAALRKRLDATPGAWRLLILDPLSRFAGTDTEKDNSAATRFVEVAESLVRSPGAPTVLVAHHTNKTSRTDEHSKASAAHARGASGLIDGVRWVCNLEPLTDDSVNLEVTKSNYSPRGQSITLVRDAEFGGYLRVQTEAEASARAGRPSASVQRAEAARGIVIRTIAEHTGLRSGNDVYQICKGNRPAVLIALRELRQEGFVELTPEGFRLSERSGLNE
jgi:hypothetical protein